jgi:hypothetical protein
VTHSACDLSLLGCYTEPLEATIHVLLHLPIELVPLKAYPSLRTAGKRILRVNLSRTGDLILPLLLKTVVQETKM